MCPSSVLVVAKSPGSGQVAGRRRSRCREEQGAGGSTPPAGDRDTTCGCRRDSGRRQRLSLEQIAPDPFRGWGRYLSAHIRAQKEPVVSPAGTGGEHRRPEGSPGISRARRQETLRAGRRECRSTGRASGRAGKHLHPPCDTSRWRGTCHCRRREHAWDAPRAAGPCLTTAGKRGWGRTCLAGFRKLWERSAACVKRLASHRTIRLLRCLYSRDNGCTTKRDRFCRFAGV